MKIQCVVFCTRLCGSFNHHCCFCFSNVSPCCPLPADGEDSTVSIQIKLENEGSDEELETDMLYSPQLALKLALTEWLGEFGVPHQYNSKNGQLFYCFNAVSSSITWNKWCGQPSMRMKNMIDWGSSLSFRPTGASKWCKKHSYRCVICGCSLSLLFNNSHNCVPAAYHVFSHVTSLSGSTHAPHGKNTSGGGRGKVYYHSDKILL